MILSMTGYGKSECNNNGINIITNISSLNSRFFDCKIRLPKRLKIFEEKIFNEVKSFCKRGRISLSIEIDISSKIQDVVEVNETKLTQYIDLINKIEKKYTSIRPISMEGVLNLPEIIKFNNTHLNEIIENNLFNSIKFALEDLNKMRKIEGANLGDDLIKRVKLLLKYSNKIESAIKSSLKENLKKYKLKLKSILDDINLDENRLLQEIVIFLEKKDITEEMIRLNSHYNLFLDFVKSDEPIGKKMNFLHQEMLREVNTIGSKTDNIIISHIVINMKEELEKVKEQVQNIL